MPGWGESGAPGWVQGGWQAWGGSRKGQAPTWGGPAGLGGTLCWGDSYQQVLDIQLQFLLQLGQQL